MKILDFSKDGAKTGVKSVWFAIAIAVTFVLFVIAANIALMGHLYTEPGDRGTAGDMFGGVTALFSGLAFAGLIITLLVQREELKLQRQEIVASNHEFALQRFDSAFFGIMKMLNDHVLSISGGTRAKPANGRMVLLEYRDTIYRLSSATADLYRDGVLPDRQLQPDGTEVDIDPEAPRDMTEYLSGLFNEYDHDLGPYFRILHNVFRLIDDEGNLSQIQKLNYARIARSHISQAELDLIFLNGVTKQAEWFKPYIERYAILKHTEKAILLEFVGHFSHLYKDSAFETTPLPVDFKPLSKIKRVELAAKSAFNAPSGDRTTA